LDKARKRAAAGEKLGSGHKPLSAQAKPGRPSGVDKEEKVSAHASRRARRAFQRDARERRLVGDEGHDNLNTRFGGGKASASLPKIAGRRQPLAGGAGAPDGTIVTSGRLRPRPNLSRRLS
jgi:hypothetical protein